VGQQDVAVINEGGGALGGALLARFDLLDYVLDGNDQRLLGFLDGVGVGLFDGLDDAVLCRIEGGMRAVGPLQRRGVAFDDAVEVLDGMTFPLSQLAKRLGGLDGDDRGALGLHLLYLPDRFVYHVRTCDGRE